jgi:hypothetical protein
MYVIESESERERVSVCVREREREGERGRKICSLVRGGEWYEGW